MSKQLKYFQIFNKKSLKYGSLSILLTVAVIAIAVLANLLVGMVQDKGIINTKFDLTTDKLYSIGDTSKEILKKLDKDVTVYVLFDMGQVNSNESLRHIKEVLSQYEKYGRVSVKYIDPDKNPGLVKQIDPNNLKDIQKGDIVVKSGNKLRKLSGSEIFQTQYNPQTGQPMGQYFVGEQGFTGAIKYVTSEKTPVIYFTQGHMEGKLESDYTLLKAQLESNNYEVKTLNLTTQEKVPEDAEIIIVASPQIDISKIEKSKLEEYLDNGGKAVFLFDYLETGTKFTTIEDLLSEYNVSLNYDKVKETDKNRYFPENPYAVVLDVPSSRIIAKEYQLLLANSRSINILKNQKEYITTTSLMKTSSTAVGEQVDKANGKDIKGPLDLAVAVEDKGGSKPSKVLVIGNGFFVSDAAREQYGQYFDLGNSFFTMSLNWMMDKKDDIVIEAKNYDDARLELTSAAQVNMIGLVLVIILPLAILGAGIFVWARRRHL